MPDRHISDGDSSRRASVLHMLLWLTMGCGVIFAPLNFALGSSYLAILELTMVGFAAVIKYKLRHGEPVNRAVWSYLLPFLGALVYALYSAPNLSVFVWILLIPTLCHRLLGPRSGSLIGCGFLVLAGVVVVSRFKFQPSIDDISMVADVMLCSVALFALSLVHEIELTRADRKLRERADVDSLTRLATRGRFREMFEQRRAAVRHLPDSAQRTVALILIDIDFFKKINDTYGHDVGDRVLAAVSGRLLHNCRQQDLLGRIGGEELAICMFALDQAEAEMHAERLRRCVADAPIRTHGHAIVVTLSLGVVLFDLARNTFDTMFSEADRRLYAAKRAGRNKVRATSVTAAAREAEGDEARVSENG
ncbi:GGDEF domain-containing protein [Salinisphaera sp. Q1T1-3]|uniref:GGDEF domain-containing protein n=1 Tax=Salinisphaera sp. Q1T1-3 TaxID=2321229 RepID=UPI001F2655AE|nr:GGDEF domain-containing protein [Salinisphaera sp. Q1T1-3]